VLAFEPDGSPVSGWPYKLPAAFAPFEPFSPDDVSGNPGPILGSVSGGQGLLYLVLEDCVVAMRADGRVAQGWPHKVPPASESWWVFAQATPDGGLLTIRMISAEDGLPVWLVDRWTSAGKVPK
jgi:hypothetical protein